MTDREALEMFLNCELGYPDEVFDKFVMLEGAKYYMHYDVPDAVYVPGKRRDRVLLVAHADTVFGVPGRHNVILDGDVYRSGDKGWGIGADDRAGCAILWLMRESGHSLLVTNDEEIGSLGAANIRDVHKDLFEELNGHQYILEFDRRHASDYKVYNIPVTEDFRRFIERSTGYTEADKSSSTDITRLCGKICGANLSVGYYYEHRPDEYLVFVEWMNTLNTARKFLAAEQPRFPLRGQA